MEILISNGGKKGGFVDYIVRYTGLIENGCSGFLVVIGSFSHNDHEYIGFKSRNGWKVVFWGSDLLILGVESGLGEKGGFWGIKTPSSTVAGGILYQLGVRRL
ncbi:MAG: hypothetical protein JKY52_08615 [Flavobacteriales bacterium]|nr:hypothetical protein [Flavobacteriales bacterium]